MGYRFTVELSKITGFDKEDTEYGVHGNGNIGCDGGTLCGMPLVDGLEDVATKKAITCSQCIAALEATAPYKKRNGKWY